MAFARDQEPRQEFFRIDEKMELVITLLQKDLEGIRVVRQYGRAMSELLADPGMMEHAFVNLVQNSIHALSLVRRPKIIVRTYQRDGRISVHSELKKGTGVVISLPVIKKELTKEEIKEIKKEKIRSGKSILLVEDEQAIADVQYRILTQEPLHHKVDIAGNGQAALDLLNKNPYDFISLDYILPGELTGMDIYHHIRSKNKTIPVLFISGNIEFLESIKDLKQRDPYMDHLSKPCKNMDYIGIINRLLVSLPV